MAIFTIGDLHLSLGTSKPMDIFSGWENYVERLRENWLAAVGPQDTVILAGDTSWAMKLEDCSADFAFLQNLPGRKLLLKGNHDYWWTTMAKMNAYLAANGFDSLSFLHNNCVFAEGLALCGTRSWLFDAGQPHDEKVMSRECGRLRASLKGSVPALSSGLSPGGRRGSGGAPAGIRRETLLLRPFARPVHSAGGAGGAGRHRV